MVIGKRDKDDLERLKRNENIKDDRPGAPEGNLNRLRHGIFANRFLTEDERKIFDAIIKHLHKDFQFNKSSDFIQVELVAIYFLKLGRAQATGNFEASEKLDKMIRCHLKDLKTTKIVREENSKKPGVTPAEWATALLDKIEAKKDKPKKKKAPKKTTKKKKTQKK